MGNKAIVFIHLTLNSTQDLRGTNNLNELRTNRDWHT